MLKARTHRIGGSYSLSQYMSLPDDGNNYELFDGELVMSPSYEFAHGRVAMFVGGKLQDFAEPKGLGIVGFDTDVVMQKHGTVLRPDVCFISKRQMSIIRGHIHGPPDLAIEVTSPSNWQNDVHFKRVQYERFGVREYWVLDIADGRNRAFAWSLRQGHYVGGEVDGDRIRSRVIKGFSHKLKDIWKAAAI